MFTDDKSKKFNLRLENGAFFWVDKKAKANDLLQKEGQLVEEIFEGLRHAVSLANLDRVIRKYGYVMGWEFCSQLVGQLRCNVRAVAIALWYPEK